MKWHALVLLVSMPALANIAPPDRGPPAPEPAAVQAEVKAEPAAVPAPEAVAAPAPAPQHPGGNANAPGMPQMMGVIEGGWAYVYAAWGAGVFGLLLYGASLFLRRSETPPSGAP